MSEQQFPGQIPPVLCTYVSPGRGVGGGIQRDEVWLTCDLPPGHDGDHFDETASVHWTAVVEI